jgi:hypothetical protein
METWLIWMVVEPRSGGIDWAAAALVGPTVNTDTPSMTSESAAFTAQRRDALDTASSS